MENYSKYRFIEEIEELIHAIDLFIRKGCDWYAEISSERNLVRHAPNHMIAIWSDLHVAFEKIRSYTSTLDSCLKNPPYEDLQETVQTELHNRLGSFWRIGEIMHDLTCNLDECYERYRQVEPQPPILALATECLYATDVRPLHEAMAAIAMWQTAFCQAWETMIVNDCEALLDAVECLKRDVIRLEEEMCMMECVYASPQMMSRNRLEE